MYSIKQMIVVETQEFEGSSVIERTYVYFV